MAGAPNLHLPFVSPFAYVCHVKKPLCVARVWQDGFTSTINKHKFKEKLGSGGGTRTPDTRIMIPLFQTKLSFTASANQSSKPPI